MKNTWYDYKNQAWVVSGKYIKCSHPTEMNCTCYGKLHEGEIAPEELKEEN
jgi:putative ribosome biogenesis GTPase RsgA